MTSRMVGTSAAKRIFRRRISLFSSFAAAATAFCEAAGDDLVGGLPGLLLAAEKEEEEGCGLGDGDLSSLL